MASYSGVYFIPAHNPAEATTTLKAITTSLETKFDNIQQLPPWSLTHRLLRGAPPLSSDKPTAAQLQLQPYQHILNLSYHTPGLTYCYVHPSHLAQQPPDTDSTALITIPTAQSDSHTHLLTTHLSAQWVLRQTLIIAPSPAYTIGEFTIRIGEVKVGKIPTPILGAVPALQNPNIPGVVVGIEIATGIAESGDSSTSESDWDSEDTPTDDSDTDEDSDSEDDDDATDEDDDDEDDNENDKEDKYEISDDDEEDAPPIKQEKGTAEPDPGQDDTMETDSPIIKREPRATDTSEKKSDGSSGSSTMRAPTDRSETMPPLSEAEERVQTCRGLIRSFWGDLKNGVAELGKESVKEVMMRGVSGLENGGPEEEEGDGDDEMVDEVVRMWCEVLRLRA